MPAVRKTTYFTDGALFSSLSHPLFLVPLPGPSSCYLSLSPRPVPFPGSISRFRLQFRFPSATQFFWHKSVYREHAPHHYTQNDAATHGISCKRVYREQKTRHYRQNLQRHRIFATKVCIANMQPDLTRKTLQRHRVFATKACIANRKAVITRKICSDTGYSPQKSVSRTGWAQKSVWHGNSVPRAIQAGFRLASGELHETG